jgi:hypothetical protein
MELECLCRASAGSLHSMEEPVLRLTTGAPLHRLSAADGSALVAGFGMARDNGGGAGTPTHLYDATPVAYKVGCSVLGCSTFHPPLTGDTRFQHSNSTPLFASSCSQAWRNQHKQPAQPLHLSP